MILAIDPGQHPGYAIAAPGCRLHYVSTDAPSGALLSLVARVVVEGQWFVGGPRRARGIGVLALTAGMQAATLTERAGLSSFDVAPVAWKDKIFRGGSRIAKKVFLNRLRAGLCADLEVEKHWTDDEVEAAALAAAVLRGAETRTFTLP